VKRSLRFRFYNLERCKEKYNTYGVAVSCARKRSICRSPSTYVVTNNLRRAFEESTELYAHLINNFLHQEPRTLDAAPMRINHWFL
jgi:hypothetical protein